MAGTSIKKSGIDPTTSTKKATWSFWVKLHNARTDGNDYFLWSSYSDANSRMHIKIDGNGNLDINERMSSSTSINLITDAEYRDVFGWYNFVVAIDTTQGTAADRVKVYVNGAQITNFSTETYPSQDEDIHPLQGNVMQYVGCYGGNVNSASYCLDGILSHCHFVDGTQYAASAFGSTDATTGEWKINTDPSLTYGNNGWFIFKNDAALTNHAGNSAGNFVLDTGTLTATKDCPSNVFCTLNPLGLAAASFTLIEGSNYSGGADNNWRTIYGTLGASAGKYYYEVKIISHNNEYIGACTVKQAGGIQGATDKFTKNWLDEGYAYSGDGQKINNGTAVNWGNSYTTNDIIGCAVDIDNKKIYFSKNGTWQESGDPTSGSTGTGAAYTLADGIYIPAMSSYNAASNMAFNFGNGLFRTTAVSSAGTNASGNGIFEYDVPAGYTAWCTKGVNS